MYLTKEAIEKAQDRVYADVETPEWGDGGKVRVRSLSGIELDRFQVSILTGRGKNRDVNLKALRCKFVALTIVNEAGAPVFGDDDIGLLGEKNAGVLNRIFQKAQELSGLNEDDVDEMVKNSETVQSADSISA